MPRLSVLLVRTAFLYLGVGFTIGALILIAKGSSLAPSLWRLLPLHIEALLVGWTLQFALGIAFWILPRFRYDAPRGRESLVWASYSSLNTGVLLIGAGQWFAWPALALLVGRMAEALALLLFAMHAWPRVKPPGK